MHTPTTRLRTVSNTAIACAGLVLAAAGCTSQSTAPTHRWASSDAVNQAQYRNDHARCQAEANITDARKLDSQGAEFAAYSQCMTSRGYELTAYRN